MSEYIGSVAEAHDLMFVRVTHTGTHAEKARVYAHEAARMEFNGGSCAITRELHVRARFHRNLSLFS